MKKTINYITCSAWWDTDVTLLPELSKQYDINLYATELPLQACQKQIDFKIIPFKRVELFKQKYYTKDIRTFGQTIFFLLKIIKSIKKDDYNIFVLGGNLYFVFFLGVLLPVSNTIIIIHNYIEHTDKRHSLMAFIKKMYYRRMSRFLFLSKSQYDLFRTDYPKKKSEYIQMPLKDYGKSIKSHSNDVITILFFGYIRPYKQLDVFINAAKKTVSPMLRFVIAGKADNWEQYEKMIGNDSRFSWDIGYISDDKVPIIFSLCDFLILPYADSTQSGPSLIALNYGIPIIASDLPPFRQIIVDNENGFLFKAGDVNALVDILDKISLMDDDDINRMKSSQLLVKEKYVNKTAILPVISEFLM